MKQTQETNPKAIIGSGVGWNNDLHDGNVYCDGIVVANCYSSLLMPETIKKNAKLICEAVNNYQALRDEETRRISAEVALEMIVEERNTLRDSNAELLEALNWMLETVQSNGTIDHVTHEGMIEDCVNTYNKAKSLNQ